MLEERHKGVQLSAEERGKIAGWIDLLVPYCGDHLEANAWSEQDMAFCVHFGEKRRRQLSLKRPHIEALIDRRDKSDSRMSAGGGEGRSVGRLSGGIAWRTAEACDGPGLFTAQY